MLHETQHIVCIALSQCAVRRDEAARQVVVGERVVIVAGPRRARGTRAHAGLLGAAGLARCEAQSQEAPGPACARYVATRSLSHLCWVVFTEREREAKRSHQSASINMRAPPASPSYGHANFCKWGCANEPNSNYR